jgi:uncharacterized protein DUF2752
VIIVVGATPIPEPKPEISGDTTWTILSLKVAGLGAFVISLLAILFFFDPARAGIFPACPLHQYTGWWCPGCGTTRALHQLLHGNLREAFRLNPLAVVGLPLLGFFVVYRERVILKPDWFWVLFGAVVMFGVLRNIPAYPFTLLAP